MVKRLGTFLSVPLLAMIAGCNVSSMRTNHPVTSIAAEEAVVAGVYGMSVERVQELTPEAAKAVLLARAVYDNLYRGNGVQDIELRFEPLRTSYGWRVCVSQVVHWHGIESPVPSVCFILISEDWHVLDVWPGA